MNPKLKNPRWPALRVLIRNLGLWRALGVGVRIERRAARGEPWLALGEPRGVKEALSRAQIGPAILMFEELTKLMGDEVRAYEIAQAAVEASGVVFMRKNLGRLDRERLRAMTEAQREAFVSERSAKFFNADMRWDRIDAEEVRFTVTACEFVRLCAAVGQAGLASMFCAVDAAYFGGDKGGQGGIVGVKLTRPHTLAGGGADCPFSLRWQDNEGAPAVGGATREGT